MSASKALKAYLKALHRDRLLRASAPATRSVKRRVAAELRRTYDALAKEVPDPAVRSLFIREGRVVEVPRITPELFAAAVGYLKLSSREWIWSDDWYRANETFRRLCPRQQDSDLVLAVVRDSPEFALATL